MRYKESSIKINMILNAVKGIMGILFPLITFPYISRVLGVEQLGRYNFASTIISYIVLLAGLGIQTYAIREGSRYRDDLILLNRFSSQMFSINILSSLFAYFVLVLLIVSVEKFHSYTSLLIVLSLQVLFKTIGVEWLYNIFEDYKYITVRSAVFQIISLILMFLFVKKESDLILYASITVLASVGSNVLNYIRSKKYCNISLTKDLELHKHIRGILVLFATTLTITIYVNSDTIILGFLCSDYEVGIYGVSVKVYTIVKTILSSAIVVSIPRLSLYLGKKEISKFQETSLDIYGTLLTLMLPSSIGLFMLRKEVVLLISGSNYLTAANSLGILSVAIAFSLGAYFWGQCILVPEKQENTVLIITISCAAVNLILNFFLIPIWKESAAAFTTLIAEFISFIACRFFSKKYVELKGLFVEIAKVTIGCIGIILVCLLFSIINLSEFMHTFFSIIGSLVVYVLIEILLKNKSLNSLRNSILSRLHIGHRR